MCLRELLWGFWHNSVNRIHLHDLGVFLHGLAGDMARDKKGAYSVLASDLVAEISSVLKNI